MDYDKLVSQVGQDWADLLKPFMVKQQGEDDCPYDKISAYLKAEKDNGNIFYPEGKNVFRAFRETPLTELRVIFMGQDPYPRAGYANGLSFGTEHEQTPPSLSMIFDGIEDDISHGLDLDKTIRDKSLSTWAQQGVLMLNAALTVKHEKPGSHVDVWQPFTDFLIEQLQQVKKDIIWIGIGAPVRKALDKVNAFRHFIFLAEHPAYAAREKRAWKHANIFTKTNLCIKMNQLGEEINWLTPPTK